MCHKKTFRAQAKKGIFILIPSVSVRSIGSEQINKPIKFLKETF